VEKGVAMKLTEHEQKMVQHLRNQRDNWQGVKWFLLCASGAILVITLFGGELFAMGTRIILAAAATYLCSYVIGGWYGRPETVLLLKLVDAVLGDEDEERTP
jgi:hypothetical protein